MFDKLRVVQFGLGPIGIASAKLALEKKCMTLVGGIDIAEDLVGRDLGEVLSLPDKMGVRVSADAGQVLRDVQPDVVLHTTSSFLPKIEAQLLACIQAGAHVVSSTEELFYPYARDRAFCERIDAAAKANRVAVAGTGVNPGFAMDVLPITLTGICTHVASIRAMRHVDAGKRRQPLQKKVGAGLSENEFMHLVEQGRLGHIGLLESLQAVAGALAWEPESIEEKILPVIAKKRVETPYFTVEPGEVAGINHTCVGWQNGRKIIDLELQMYLGAEAPHDRVFIEGSPPINMRIEGGIFGDSATVAALINTAARIKRAAPGLRTMLDLDIPRACV